MTNTYNKRYELADLLAEDSVEKLTAPVLLNERSSSVDLLGRGYIVNALYDSILFGFNDYHATYIGLEGEWGTGKTTIINLVKERFCNEQYSVVDENTFDPSFYQNQGEVISGLFYALKEAKGFCIAYEIKNAVIFIAKALGNIGLQAIDKYTGIDFINTMSPDTDTNDKNDNVNDIAKCKSIITKNLSKNKRIIFLENLDRSSVEVIIVLLKVIKCIFDVPNTVFVLSYSQNRLLDVFKNSQYSHPKYFEKIIDQVISIPVLHSRLDKKVVEKSLKNLLSIYKFKEPERYNDIVDLITSEVKDLRCLKRLINSAFYKHYAFNKHTIHDLLIDCLPFLNYDLWQTVNDNPAIFSIAEEPGDLQEALKDVKSADSKKDSYASQITDIRNHISKKYPEYHKLFKKYFDVYAPSETGKFY